MRLSLWSTWDTLSITQFLSGLWTGHTALSLVKQQTYLPLRMWDRSQRALERHKSEERQKPFPGRGGEWSQEAGWCSKVRLVPLSIIFRLSCIKCKYNSINSCADLVTLKVEEIIDFEAACKQLTSNCKQLVSNRKQFRGKIQIMPITFTHLFIHLYIQTTVFMYILCAKYHGEQKYTKQGFILQKLTLTRGHGLYSFQNTTQLCMEKVFKCCKWEKQYFNLKDL